MPDIIRKTFNDSLCQFLIDNGKKAVDLANPLSACKLALETLEEHNKDRFIEDVLKGLRNVDTESLKAEKSLERLYKSLQVIAKATTQDKINRFKKLTINGIIYQNSTSDNDYELYLSLVDNLNDMEILVLKYLLDITIPTGKDNSIETFYNKTGITKQELKSYVQRLVSYGITEEQILIKSMNEGEVVFSHRPLMVEADDYPNKKVPKYYRISKLGESLLNFISLGGEVNEY